jgi:hypothetical protein
LSRASREGLIDETPQSLAAAIGVDVDTLLACIQSFMEPDPDSRSPEHEGRRLALIDSRRTWGWKVLNHSKYREKARKKNYDENRTESGSDADRKRQSRKAESVSRDVPTRPDASRDVPLSEAEANKSKKPSSRESSPKTKKPTKVELPEGLCFDAELTEYAQKHLPGVDPPELFESFKRKALAGGWVYVDWRRALQDFIRNAAPGSGHFAAGQYPKVGGVKQNGKDPYANSI